MNLYDQTRAEKLIDLARKQFDPELKQAEVKVLRDTASSVPPSLPEKDVPRPEVRAEFLRWLVVDPEARPYIDALGLRVLAATIIGDLHLGECRNLPSLFLLRCNINGKVTFQSAETNGICFEHSAITGDITADRVIVHGEVDLEGFSSPGMISFAGAQIDAQLVCTGAKLTKQYEPDKQEATLVLDGAKIGGDVFLDDGFACPGWLRMRGASIGGQLNFMGASVGAVSCDDLQLMGDLLWCGLSRIPQTELHLPGARIGILRDDRASWPEQGKLNLLGLVYGDLILHADPKQEPRDANSYRDPRPLQAAERIEWLMLQNSDLQTQSQPWMQLRSHLEAKGDKAGAKHVSYKLNLLRASQLEWHPWKALGLPARQPPDIPPLQQTQKKPKSPAWPYLRHPNRGAAIAFAWLEERPSRILYSIALTLLLGTLIFAGAGPSRSGAMIPTARESNGQPLSGAALASYPRYQPFVYTLENALPLVKLGMDDKWAPDPDHSGQAWFPQCRWLDWLGWFNSYWFLTVSRWLLILSGWFQATVLAAALANRFKQ